MWGLSPLYYAQMNHLPPLEIVAHRILWALPPILVWAALTGRMARLRAVASEPRRLGAMLASTAMISCNWIVFVQAIQWGETREASFGYYVYPILAVPLGALLFRERVDRLQWLAVGFAGAGVAWIGLRLGTLPWLGLLTALTFAAYGLIRKAAAVGPMVGVIWELALTLPVIVVGLALIGGGAFVRDAGDAALLVGGSLFTGLPLILFVEASKVLRFGTVGVLFYLNPTLQLVSAVILGEAIGAERLIGFALIWVAVVLYCAALLRAERSASMAAAGSAARS